MATRLLILHIASCDVCGHEDEYGGGAGTTPEEAVDLLLADPDEWTRTPTGRLVCGHPDPAHDTVRGTESPRLLAMSPDAMTATYPTVKENQPA
jgi:hypothetical protein